MTNSTFTNTSLLSGTSTRNITIEDTFYAEGDNVFDIAGTPTPSATSSCTYLCLGASSGTASGMKVTGSGTITKKGDVQLVLCPNTDMTKNTFSGKWIVEKGEIWSRGGSSSEQRLDFFPGSEIEVLDGGIYRIYRMYGAGGFISGGLSGQTITVKDGGILDIDPITTNNITVLQTINIEKGGTFNANAATGTATLTITDLTLDPGAIHNVYYGATAGNSFKVNNTVFKAIQTSFKASGLLTPIVTYGTGALKPVYAGNITFDLAFESGETTADISDLFDYIPDTYTKDIFMTYPISTEAGDYTIQLPTIDQVGMDNETWILYDGGEQKVDLSKDNNSYKFTAPDADMVFKWDVSTIATGIDNPSADKGAIVSEKYYTLTGIQVLQPATGLLIKKVVYDNGVVETTKIFKK